MKSLLAIGMLTITSLAWAGDMPASPAATGAVITGEVLEVKDVESYSYLRLKTKDGETWAAVSRAPLSKGAKVTIENPMVMNNFESKSLKKTFPTIIFGSLSGSGSSAGNVATAAHAGMIKSLDTASIHVPKASGENARSVEEINTKAAQLKDKPVAVRGKVVKYNQAIMGKNWIHLRDGTGSAANNTNDILVTSASPAKVGDVLTVRGVVRTDKDFGAGYFYKVLIEDATLLP